MTPPQLIEREDTLVADRFRYAALALREYVQVDPEIRGGIPVVTGTRFTVAQLLAELAEDRSLSQIAEAFRLDLDKLQKLLESLAICLDRP